ncbi:MAG: hypothetical protein EA361_02795 [Bacteroidetes bacterium]|nr:MAG: hypothetical protein EA361_02795 [Bacteroidota bacterium]
MKRTFYSIILVLISVSSGISQFRNISSSLNGTVALGDTLLFSAEIEKPATWPAEVRARKPGDDFVLYRAGDATEVTIDNKTYRALRVEKEDGSHGYYFTEELSHGKAKLFHSTRGKYRFYVKTDKQTGVDRNNYRQIINELAEPCENSFCDYQKTVFTKSSMAYFFERYNDNRLNVRFPMPFVAAGIQYNSMNFFLPEDSYLNIRLERRTLNSTFYSPALTVHFPFYTYRFFGVDIRLISHSGNSVATFDHLSTDNYVQDVLIDFSMLQLDAALRYSFSWKRIEPYISLGISGIYDLDFSNKMIIIQRQDNIYTTSYIENFYQKSGWFTGITIHQGVQYYFLPRNFIAAGWGYSHYTDSKFKDYQLSNLSFNFSINFWPW